MFMLSRKPHVELAELTRRTMIEAFDQTGTHVFTAEHHGKIDHLIAYCEVCSIPFFLKYNPEEHTYILQRTE
jgi:hypothetical protein